MAAGAAAALAGSSSRAALVDQSHANSACSCCLCRHSCQCCRCDGGGSTGLSEENARLAAALIAARSTDRSAAITSLVLFAASVGVILAKLGSSSKRARGQMHSFHRRRSHFQDRKDRFYVKRYRKSRWEWRPVTHRSASSQTLPLDLATSSTPLGSSPSTSPTVVEAWSQVPEETSRIDSSTEFPKLSRHVVEKKATMINSLIEFPDLSKVALEDVPPPRPGGDVKDLVAASLKLSPLPMVELLRTDSICDAEASTSSTTKGQVDHPSPPAQEPQEDRALNRKQRKHLKKKQKKLVAASRTFQISSLPVLKQWKSSSSLSPPPFRKLDLTPCKIYDCAASKTFGPLGSPSSKSIAWTFSSSKPSCDPAPSSSTASPCSPPSQSISSVTSSEGKVIHPEVSEISESPKSYLGDWTDSESSKRSNSDPEEIELDVPSLDFEFEEDSEDYSFHPSVSNP